MQFEMTTSRLNFFFFFYAMYHLMFDISSYNLRCFHLVKNTCQFIHLQHTINATDLYLQLYIEHIVIFSSLYDLVNWLFYLVNPMIAIVEITMLAWKGSRSGPLEHVLDTVHSLSDVSICSFWNKQLALY